MLLVSVGTLALHGQTLPFFNPEVLSDVFRGADEVTVEDINQDGLPDLVIYRGSPPNYVVEYRLNIGDNFLGPTVTIDDDAYESYELVTGDLNGDGIPDLVTGSSGDTRGIRVFLNRMAPGTATPEFEETQRFTGFVTRSIEADDLDGDGDLDLIYQSTNWSTSEHRVNWRENIGAGSFGAERLIAQGRADKILAADLDADDDPDLIVLSSFDNSIRWYRNNGDGSFRSETAVESGASDLRDFDAADADNDGDMDIVAIAGQQAYYYRNDRRRFTRRNPFGIFASGSLIRFVKADEDDLPDLVYEGNNTLRYRKNTGAGTFGSEITFSNAGSDVNMHAFQVVDFDGDQREDLVGTLWGNENVIWFPNATGVPPQIVSFSAADNTLLPGETTTLTWQVNHATSVAIDGEPVTGTSLEVTAGDTEHVYIITATNDAGSVTSKAALFVPEQVFDDQVPLVLQSRMQFSDVESADLDGDGRPDLVYASTDADQFGWYPADGNGGYGERRLIDTTLDEPVEFLAADLDQDGDVDLALGFRDGANIYRNDGEGNFTIEPLSSMRCSTVSSADMNHDGWPDLILADRSFQPIRIALNDGSGGFPAEVNTELGHRSYKAIAADVDEDGIEDLIRIGESSGSWLRGTGPVTFTPGGDLGSVRRDCPVYYTDIDQDGHEDVVMRTGSSTIGVIRGRGRGFFDSLPLNLNVPNLSNFTLADFDGDLDHDIGFVTPSSSSPKVAGWLEGDGTGKFSEPFVAAPGPVNSYLVKARDLDLDGDLDLLATTEGQIFWMRNVTEHATPPSIDRFESEFPVIHRGESVSLHWAVTGNTTVSISPNIGEVNGNSITLTPSKTTTYLLTATNRNGTETREITVEVVDRPVIHRFEADANDVDRTTEVTLSWTVAGADELSISPGIGSVTGSSTTTPVYETTRFTLTATNAHGSDSVELELRVNARLFAFAESLPELPSLHSLTAQAIADLDGDGFEDLIAAVHGSTGNDSLYWRRCLGNGSFGPPQIIQVDQLERVSDITVADFDGDGRLDLAITSGYINREQPPGGLLLLRNNPNGSWSTSLLDADGGTTVLTALHAVDWDLDGDPDIVASSERLGEVVWFQNLGRRGFRPRRTLGGSFTHFVDITSADIDGDNNPDVVVHTHSPLTGLMFLRNLGNGSAGEQQTLVFRPTLYGFDFGDLDGDGDLDLGLALEQTSEIYLNSGSGSFTLQQTIPFILARRFIRMGDVDSDGDLDLLWLSSFKRWSENLGDGTFQMHEATDEAERSLGGTLLLGDFDGDGDLDAAGGTAVAGFDLDWFRNLSTPSSGPPVIGRFTADTLAVLPGKRVGLAWEVSGFPTEIEISPAVQTTPLSLTQRHAVVTSVATDTETVQTYVLTARNRHGETTRELPIRVGNPPQINSFTHGPALVNQGDPVELFWQISRADQLRVGELDASGMDGIAVVPDEAPFATLEITASNIFGESSATTIVEVNRPPSATSLGVVTAGPGADPVTVDTAPSFSDPDEGDPLTWSVVDNSFPSIFSAVDIDAATGALDLAFAPHVDGESTLVVRATDRNGLSAESALRVVLPRIPDPGLSLDSSMVLNPQTGLYEQRLRVTNEGSRSIGGFFVEISGLPEGVSVRDTRAPTAGRPWILTYGEPVAAGATVELQVEFYSSQRGALAIDPVFTVVQTSAPEKVLSPDGEVFAIDRLERLPDGSILIEWEARAGATYHVQYTDGAGEWQTSPGPLRTAANRLQWIDHGPPRTPSPPGEAPKRMYRVLRVEEP